MKTLTQVYVEDTGFISLFGVTESGERILISDNLLGGYESLKEAKHVVKTLLRKHNLQLAEGTQLDQVLIELAVNHLKEDELIYTPSFYEEEIAKRENW